LSSVPVAGLVPGRSPKSRRRPYLVAAAALITLPLIGLGIGLFGFLPSYAPAPVETAVVVGDRACQQPALLDEAGRVFLSIDTVQNLFDSDVTLDTEFRRALIPYAGHTIPLAVAGVAQQLAATPPVLNAPYVADSAGLAHVPLDILAVLGGLTYRYFEESNTVVIDRPGETVQMATVVSGEAYVRQTPSLLSFKLSRLGEGDQIRVFGQTKGRYIVRDAAGRLGYVPLHDLRPETPTVSPWPDGTAHTPPPSLEGQKISLAWEAVGGANPNPADIGEMPSLNVVSPTWFHLVDTQGTIQNLGDATYVKWAHDRGYQVWGLVTNGFSLSRTRATIPDAAMRQKIIRQLLAYAAIYDLDGINMDFENMYLSEKNDYVALIREMAPLAKEQGLVLSVDVTFLSTSEAWSRCFDRPALSEICDYVMVMAYDEHVSGTDHSGSVGSLPWVEYGLQRLLDGGEIPAAKLVLGLPFYTRLWTEERGHRPKQTVYSMRGVHQLLEEKNLTPVYDPETGQNYVEFTENGLRQRLWIEDEVSMAQRVRLVAKYGFAGVAAWRRGFEDPETWTVIERELGPGTSGQ